MYKYQSPTSKVPMFTMVDKTPVRYVSFTAL